MFGNLSTELPRKGKPTPKNKPTNRIAVDDSDDSLSSLSDGSQGHSDKLDDSDEDNNNNDDEDDNEFDVAQMTEREVRQLFIDEVTSFILGSVPNLKFFILAAPGCSSRCSLVI